VRGGIKSHGAAWLAARLVVFAVFALVVGLLSDSGASIGNKFAYGVIFLVLMFALQLPFHWWQRRHPPIDRDPNELHAPPNKHAPWPATRL
jgi:hypothetical protein